MRLDLLEEIKELIKKREKVKHDIAVIEQYLKQEYNLNSCIGIGIHHILDTFEEKEDKHIFLSTILTLKEKQLDEIERELELM